MARCNEPGCDWYGKKAGLAIHKAKVHGIHRGYGEGIGEASCHIEAKGDSWTVESTLDTETGKVTIREVEPKPERLMEPIISRWSP